MSHLHFPALADWAPTRQTLHAYTRVLTAIRRTFTPEQDDWQHISLRLYTAGLTTTPIPHPKHSGRTFALSMDLRNHYVLLTDSEGEVQQFRISECRSATELGDLLLPRLAAMDVLGEVPRSRFENDEERSYAMEDAERFLSALSSTSRAYDELKEGLKGDLSPVQLWPHDFDFTLMVYGQREVEYEEHGKPMKSRAKISFGLAPPDSSQPAEYFFVKPIPFEVGMTAGRLPAAASWHTEGWQGALLPYAEVAAKGDARQRLLDFFRAAYRAQQSILRD